MIPQLTRAMPLSIPSALLGEHWESREGCRNPDGSEYDSDLCRWSHVKTPHPLIAAAWLALPEHFSGQRRADYE
jgi:hypothetical protein